jgi:hypothetical protein
MLLRQSATARQEVEALVTGCAYFFTNYDEETLDGFQIEIIETQIVSSPWTTIYCQNRREFKGLIEWLRSERIPFDAHVRKMWVRFESQVC